MDVKCHSIFQTPVNRLKKNKNKDQKTALLTYLKVIRKFAYTRTYKNTEYEYPRVNQKVSGKVHFIILSFRLKHIQAEIWDVLNNFDKLISSLYLF